jgi:hypothetical protein
VVVKNTEISEPSNLFIKINFLIVTAIDFIALACMMCMDSKKTLLNQLFIYNSTNLLRDNLPTLVISDDRNSRVHCDASLIKNERNKIPLRIYSDVYLIK